MREMVLNHASVLAPGSDRVSINRWLVDLAGGMAVLVRDGVVQRNLRMARGFHDTPCLPDYSLWAALQGLRTHGRPEEYRFLMGLAAKIPLLSEVGEEIENRFLGCEERMLPPPDGEPLVFCAITDGIAVGFPSAAEWEHDRVTVRFNELLPDGTTESTSEGIDQLTRSVHAAPICDRYRHRLRAGRDPATLWENRAAAFPSLGFGPGVENNLRSFAHLFSTIVGKLDDLEASARDWVAHGGPAPSWRTKVTPESNHVMNAPALREARRFPSGQGTHELFEWHARFGNHGRIHLRFDPASREVEIGYIGPHLPG